MKPLLPMAGLLLALGGCSQTPQPSLQPSRHAEPMASQILPRSPGVGLRIRVDRPAYAALYQIIPGAGVSQMYPALGTGNMEGRVFAGNTSLNTLRLANLEDYAPSPLLANGPRFYFLITSDRPLDIDRFGTFGVGLRRELGLQFTGFNAYDTMERIAEMTIPVPGDEESWSTDLYVEWPNVLFDGPVAGRVLVPLRCGSYRMYVPVDRVVEVDTRVCHPERLESPDAPQSPETPRAPTDSARSARPRPGAPTPPTSKPASPKPADQRIAAEEVRERIMASAQLEESGDGARGTPRNRSALRRSAGGGDGARSGRDSDRSGSSRGARYDGSRSSSAGADAASARAAERSSGQSSSSGSRTPQPAASPAPAPAPAAAPAPSSPAPAPVVRERPNGG